MKKLIILILVLILLTNLTIETVKAENLIDKEIKYLEERVTIPHKIESLRISDKIILNQEEICKKYNMFDKNPLTGFIDDWGFCVPGLVTTEVWFTKSPQYVYGTAVPYSPGMMKATAIWRELYEVAYKYGTEYLGGVATPSPADIGETVWLRREGFTWEGPYLVVDCSRRADMTTHIAINQQVVEIDFNTAVRWGIAHYTKDWWEIDIAVVFPVEVFYGTEKPKEDIRERIDPIFFAEYWLDTVAEFQRDTIEPTPIIEVFGLNPYWNLLDGEGAQCFTTLCNIKKGVRNGDSTNERKQIPLSLLW